MAWKHLEVVLGTSWGVFGTAEGHLEDVWEVSWTVLVRLGNVLEASWAVLVRLGNVSAPIFPSNGANLNHSILAVTFGWIFHVFLFMFNSQTPEKSQNKSKNRSFEGPMGLFAGPIGPFNGQ